MTGPAAFAAPVEILKDLEKTELPKLLREGLEKHCGKCAGVLCSKKQKPSVKLVSATAEQTGAGIKVDGMIEVMTCYRWQKAPQKVSVRALANAATCKVKIEKFEADGKLANAIGALMLAKEYDIADPDKGGKCDHYFPKRFRGK